ncbi:hypothetical protein [Saccharopolyspora spinosa]|uniref:Uncharacterized protein n=1 Tax=Saccharopolyspora spinosa TaxID=60894 RepID=A0A2N3XSR7_SACSN|nr:hypothetical protein [Saccharopolyspora spinosa]PKW13640.1 hypothetical protein A8926_1184 [Saccharopolyspora spinosa]
MGDDVATVLEHVRRALLAEQRVAEQRVADAQQSARATAFVEEADVEPDVGAAVDFGEAAHGFDELVPGTGHIPVGTRTVRAGFDAAVAANVLLRERDQAAGDLGLLGRPPHRLSGDVVGQWVPRQCR